ncbi:MAG: transglutaminase family protein [Bacteroidota bacterium]
MNYQVTHTTAYTYKQAVSLCHNIARLIPRDTVNQVCKTVSVIISPQPDVVNEYLDFFGNKVMYFAVQEEHEKLTVTVSSEITRHPHSKELNENSNMPWEKIRQLVLLPSKDNFEARQFIAQTTMTAGNGSIEAFARQSFTDGRPVFEATLDLTKRIYAEFEFKPGFSTIATPVDEIIEARKGVCQDFAHLAIACLRSIGLPARYISGYIETLPPPGVVKLTGVDASHAWFAIYIPGVGWLDFDPTNNQVPDLQHITIGWGRDYADIAPLKGVILSSGKHKLDVSVDVKRVTSL